MRRIRLIALNVFKESVRDKILYSIVLFAVLMISTSYLIAEITAGQDMKIIKDLGLASISLFGLLIAIFIGIGLVWKEMEKRSIYTLLSKPIRRSEFIVGKYLGLVLTLTINVGTMATAFYGLLGYIYWTSTPTQRAVWPTPAADPAMLAAILLIMIELMLVTAIALFFSTFSTPFLSAALTIGLWVIGHFNDDLRNIGSYVHSPVAASVGTALYYVVPNFAAFDVKAQTVYGQLVPSTYIALTAAYGLTYVGFVLAAAVTIFSRRDFK